MDEDAGKKVEKEAEKKDEEEEDDEQEDEDEEEEEEEEEEGEEEEGGVQLTAKEEKAVQRELKKVNKNEHYDPAREGGFSDSSSEESSSDEESEDEEDDEAAQELEYQQTTDIPLGEVTKRIAAVNLDWDNFRPADIMAVCSSFCPPGGKILRVAIYPSEFGKERLEREEVEGPPKELFADTKGGSDSDSDESDNDEKIKQSLVQEDDGAELDSTRLRKYQLERLRYFFAVITCSSEDCAKRIYDAIDGTEYMTSANFFDLRFVPHETEFDDSTIRDECTSIPAGYKPNDFSTDALQHSKAKLTWDADDKSRKEAQAKAFQSGLKEIDENDLKAYLANDSSSDEDEDAVEVVDASAGADGTQLSKKEAARQKTRALLGLSDKPTKSAKESGPVGDMEVTFSAGLTSGDTKAPVFENEPKDETTVEKYIRKERERKARRKANMKASRDGGAAPDNDKEPESKPEPETASANIDNSDRGFDDPFFTAPEHNAATASAQRSAERRKKREEREADERATQAKRAELELLMVDDKDSNIKHFDMKEIEKAEKQSKKRGKKGKKSQEETAPVKDDFNMNVKDPRFASLWESHEYAIDPSNPKYKPTQGMKALLEEGRKRRRYKESVQDSTDQTSSKKKRRKDVEGDNVDLDKLVERVKSKAA